MLVTNAAFCDAGIESAKRGWLGGSSETVQFRYAIHHLPVFSPIQVRSQLNNLMTEIKECDSSLVSIARAVSDHEQLA